MMNSKEFQLIALKTALLRCDQYGKIVDSEGQELTLDQLKEKLFVNLSLPADTAFANPDTDVDIDINTVQNISNVTIINNEIESCDHNTEPEQAADVAQPTIEPEPKKTLAGKLFQYFKDNKNGPSGPTTN